jgi:hypothetical protein
MKNNFFIIVSFVILLNIMSCADNRLDHITPPKIYIPQSGKVDLTIYKTGEPFVFKLGVFKSGYEKVSADVQLNVMSEAELEAYNYSNNTSYRRLPDNCFQLNDKSLNFSEESRLEYVGILIDYEEIDKISDFDEQNSAGYVIPVIVTQASIDKNEEKLETFIKPLIRDPLIYFRTLSSKISIEAKSTSKYSQELLLGVDFPNEWDISVNLKIDPDLVEKYNLDNDKKLSLLPANAYTITENPVIIEKGKKTAESTIIFDSEKIDYDDFVLPVVIENTSKFSVDPERNVHFVVISKPAMRFDRTGWTIAGFSSEEAAGEGAGNGVASCILDGNSSTYWHSQWAGGTGQLPHYITVDMKKDLMVTSVDLQRRPNQRDTKAGNFYISSDNVTFTKIGTFEMAEVNEAQIFKVTTTRGRYIKVEITESRRPPFANLSELYIRGVE